MPGRVRPWPALLAGLLLGASAACGADTAMDTVGGPVITPPEPWEAYPAAGVTGRLSLREDCLLLSGDVVFWPHGTRWDPAAAAVVLADGEPAVVGETFDGGGGNYAASTDFVSLLDDVAAREVEECLERTGAPGVVFAYGVSDPG